MPRKVIIGRETRIDFVDDAIGVPAKIDTGADSSAVWASDIHIDDTNRLCFKLFEETSPFYTGRTNHRRDYSVARVKSASGDVVLKFKTHLTIKIKEREIRVLFGLSNRSTHTYPVLIGKRTLQGKFVVDVSKTENIHEPKKRPKVDKLNRKLAENPRDFYEKYYKKGTELWK